MTLHQLLVTATEYRKAAFQCRKYPTIARVNLEMAEYYERKANVELVLNNTESEE